MSRRSQPGMKIPDHLRGAVKSVAKHEAGHLIVSRVYGFPFGDCTATIVDLSGAYTGGAEQDLARGLVSLEEVELYLNHRIQILYAGAMAESLTAKGKVDNDAALKSIRSGSAQRDYAKVPDLIHLARNLKHPQAATRDEIKEQINAIESRAWEAATACVEAEHAMILGFAGRLEDAILAAGLGVTARIPAAEICALPAMIERFGAE